MESLSTWTTPTCLRDTTLLPFTFVVVTSQLHIPGQIINKFVEAEDTEADLVVGCFGAALKQAGKGHSRWCTRWGGQLQIGEVGVGTGALVDHPGSTPAVWITGK